MSQLQAAVVIGLLTVLVGLTVLLLVRPHDVQMEPKFWCYFDSHRLGPNYPAIICNPGTLVN